jgi:type II secretory pathway pseudopilin PulG
MKTQILFRKAIVLILVSILSITAGCKKDKEDKDQRAAIDNATAENAFNDVFNQVDNAAKATVQSGAKVTQLDSGGCATITITPFDTITWPKTMTIDFGSSNCLCSDGKYRRGKVIANLSGKYRNAGTIITITLDQYYVNDNHVQGTKTITNLGHTGTYGGGNNLKYSIVVSNASITTQDGTISWNSTRTREWIEGESTLWPNWQDDVYLISGSASGTDVNGNAFNVNIVNPLRAALNCRWIESGTLEITPSGLATRTVDFGGGNCDDQATVTINGNTYNFTMH